MAVYLFISSTTDMATTRRVDFENYASLFSDVDEPDTVRRRRPFITWLSAILLLVLASGATIVLARTEAHMPGGSTAAIVSPARPL